MKIKIKDTDIAIVVRKDGTAEAYIPLEDDSDISWEALHSMLKEIRKLEMVFTELVNKTYGDKENKND